MGRQSRYLYIMDMVERKFSMMDLEFPATPKDLVEIVVHIFKLDNAKRDRVIRALKGQLLIDFFLFMPSVYGGIFLLSMKVATKMNSDFGKGVFVSFAWLQGVAFVLDIIENIYIWRKIKPDIKPSGSSVHKAFLWLEIFKWGLPLLAFVCCLSSMLYFWITGLYSINSYSYMGIIAAEIAVFIVVGALRGKRAGL